MRLRLSELQGLVNSTIIEEKSFDELRSEISRVLGPVVDTDRRIDEVAAAANDRLDVLERTGKIGQLTWNHDVVSKWLSHRSPELRKFSVRTSPMWRLIKATRDKDASVRAAAASRVPVSVVKEMVKRFPNDDQLNEVLRSRLMTEAGLSNPETCPMGHDPTKDATRLGDVAKTNPGSELSETWYDNQARNMLNDYGRNIEYTWEEAAVRRFCASTKATSGVEVDESKLLKSIKKLIKEKEDMALERNALKETLEWLQVQEEKELLDEGVLPEVIEESDSVKALVESRLTGESFIKAAKRLFRIEEGTLPLSIRKYRLGEGNARQTIVPVIGYLPHKEGIRAIDERALDTFCECWTKRQQLDGEPLRLEWTSHPTDVNKVGFTCILK